MAFQFLSGNETDFLIKLAFSLVVGTLIGIEREFRGKVAGIHTHSLVIAGAMLFSYISAVTNPSVPTSMAVGIISGVGFLGAGIIIRGSGGHIVNLSTAASLWLSAGIGIAFGLGWYAIGTIAGLYSIIIPRIHHHFREKKQ